LSVPRNHSWTSIAPWMLLLTTLALVLPAAALEDVDTDGGESGYDDIPTFGGPGSVGEQLKEDDEVKQPYFRFERIQRGLKPWFDWKRRLNDEHGLSFGLYYSALYQNATNSAGEDDAAGGMLQIPVSWTFSGRGTENTSTLVFKAEHRHRLGTDIAPQDLGFDAGAVSITGTQFSGFGLAVTNLYWHQSNKGGRLNFVAGRVDPTDYLDIYGLINPQTAFMNLAFSTNPTIASPNQGFGAAIGAALGEKGYIVGGFSDANAKATTSGFDTFFSDREYFKHFELGRFSSFDRRYFDNTHVTLWHADRRDDAGVPEGWGATFSYTKFIGDRVMPFVRAGYSDGGGGALLERMVSGGVGILRRSHDLIGVGLSWGEPSEDSFSPGLDDQYTAEVSYRITLSQNSVITPDLQWIIDPALNPQESSVLVFGLRLRLTL